MADIILVTGGTRSGKSDYAQRRAEALPGGHCFIATCRASDPEMAERVRKHQSVRSSMIWQTVEEGLEPGRCISDTRYEVCLVDCLTLWISNLMVDCAELGVACDEQYLIVKVTEVLDAAAEADGTVIFVTNEVGMGIVPENDLARRYRDLVGLGNRLIAAQADEVVLVSCGLPVHLKKNKEMSTE